MNEKKTFTNDLYVKKNAIISLGFYIVLVAVNYLSAMGYINGNSQKAVSKSFPTLITPAGYAFAIWGVIYLFILVSILLPLFKKSEIHSKNLNAVYKLFWISTVVNIAWTFVFSFKMIWLSAILIVVLLVMIFMILMRLNSISGDKKGFYDLGFGLYAGWLSIASVVNFCAFLVSINFDFFGNPTMFYSAILLVFIVVVSLLQKVHNNPFYNLAIVWAFVAIIAKSSTDMFSDPRLMVLALGVVVLLVVDAVFSLRKMKFYF